MSAATVYLGDDKSAGGRVEEPIGHLAVFGLTRRAGKTTTLRTFVHSSGADSIVFRTGRGEILFPEASPAPAVFRARLDWHAVESMLWSFLSEKPKIYRPIIMRAVGGAKSLEDVHRTIVKAGLESKNPWVRDRTYELDQYFREILPWLREHRLLTRLQYRQGQNVVDLEGWPETVQQLVIATTLELLMEGGRRDRPLIVVLPEARTFIPHDRASPVKLAADRFTRMGAKLNLFLWIDSQALTGVDQLILRNFAIVLQGVQTSDIEIKRTCGALDGIKPAMVRSLRVGDFILHTLEGVRTVHVPLLLASGSAPPVAAEETEESMDAKEREDFERRISILEDQLRVASSDRDMWRGRAQEEEERAEVNAKAAAANAVGQIKAAPIPAGRAPSTAEADRERVDLHVQRDVPNLTVHVREVRVDASAEENPGRAALLIAEGFFDQRKSVTEVCVEFRARGWGDWKGGSGWNNMDRILEKLATQGFLRSIEKGYVLVPEARSRIRKVVEPQ